MRKLKLDVESLTVESFEPAAAPDSARGTVQAHSDPVAALALGVGKVVVWLSSLL